MHQWFFMESYFLNVHSQIRMKQKHLSYVLELSVGKFTDSIKLRLQSIEKLLKNNNTHLKNYISASDRKYYGDGIYTQIWLRYYDNSKKIQR